MFHDVCLLKWFKNSDTSTCPLCRNSFHVHNPQFTGTVKWFNDSKGFGFIERDDGAEDLFCHFSSMVGFAVLKSGQRVAFDVRQGPKGLQATNVQVL